MKRSDDIAFIIVNSENHLNYHIELPLLSEDTEQGGSIFIASVSTCLGGYELPMVIFCMLCKERITI